MEEPKFLSGQLLLAMPGIGDPRFEKAVIAMCVHDENGALGIGLGRIVPRISFHNLLKQLDIEPGVAPDVPIHLGGPVEPQRGFLLHSPDWGAQESIHVGDRWVLSATLDILRAIAEGRGPSRWVAALGYAGWGAGQLEQELCGNGWFATAGSEALLYECDVNSRWATAFRSAGIDPRLLTADFGTA
jgi:putative transcriptional regulator